MSAASEFEVRKRHITRRGILAGGAALAGAGLLPRAAFATDAPPFTFKQADFDVTVVSDGDLVLPVDIVAPEAPREELLDLLKSMGEGPTEVHPETNAVLIRGGSDLVLVDTGGAGFQPSAGKLHANLKRSGIDPAAVTKVVFTHGHPDHVWGTVGGDGALLYPNAAYYVSAAEWDFWMDPELKGKMPPEMGGFIDGAQKHFGAVKDRVTMLKPGAEVMTGVSLIDTAGHTPGHVSLDVAGGGGLIITADAIANPIVFFPHPDWKFGFDAIPDLAVENRKKLLDRAAKDRIALLGYHWPYPGVGFAEPKGRAYRYVPIS